MHQHSTVAKYLRNRNAVLEAQMQKSNEVKITTILVGAKDKQAKDLSTVFLEKRRKLKFNTFKRGTLYEAQQWLNCYEVLANHLGFTDNEKRNELIAVRG